jgi:protein O-GlcNAc transferase
VSFERAHRLYAAGELSPALTACRTLVAEQPGSADAWNLTGLVLTALGERAAACRFYWRALELDPGFVEAHNNLGSALCSIGQAGASLAAFEQALRLRADDPAATDNLLLASLCAPEVEPETVAERSRRWGERLEATIEPLPRRPAQTGDRLHVGYVSADLRRHSVAFFLEPILAHHDRSRLRVHAYANLAGPGDEVTARLRARVDVWRWIAGRSDREVARQIAADGIDVLVDLSGHTAGHRLAVFAHQPAAVQISYLGYPATTGLSRIGYRLTDARADPPGTERLHSEQLVPLPGGFLCYRPPGPARGGSREPAPPSGANPITFGSFNDLSKMSDRLLAVWAQILAQVPGARLRLKNRALGDGAVRARVLQVLRSHGLEAARVDLEGWKPGLTEHLESYRAIDVALDTYPYNGTTTTCEALWMGAPVVTWVGPAHVSRVGLSLLGRCGLDQLCATSEVDYIARAVALARDPTALAELRRSLRDHLQPLLDAPPFVRALEDTYRELHARAVG